MARKSGWQNFSDNFNSVYGTFSKAAQDFESADIMDDEKFMAEGGLGYNSKTGKALEGTALEKARYKALGDIATKYGNAKEGLGYRQQLSNLESSERENTINQSIMAELINQRGALTSAQMRSQTSANDASASLSYARGNEITTLLGPKLDRAKELARSAGFEADVAGINAYLAQNTKSKTLEKQIAELETNIAEANVATTVAKAPSAVAAGIANNERIAAESTTATLIADSDYSWLAPIAQQKVDYLQANNDASMSNLQLIADSAELKSLAAQHAASQSTAERDSLKLKGLFEYNKGIQSGRYGKIGTDSFDEKAATNDFLQLTAAFEGMPAATELYNKYVKTGNETALAEISQIGLEMGARVTTALRQPNGLDRVIEIYDEYNGEGEGSFGMRLDEDDNGRVSIIETNPDGTDRIEIAAADNRILLGEMLQTMAGPTAMIGLAERFRESAKTGLETRKTNKDIENTTSTIALRDEQLKLVQAQTDKVKQEIASSKASLPEQEKIAWEGLGKMLGDVEFGLEDVELRRSMQTEYMKSMGMLTENKDGSTVIAVHPDFTGTEDQWNALTPEGISFSEAFLLMSPEDQALFLRGADKEPPATDTGAGLTANRALNRNIPSVSDSEVALLKSLESKVAPPGVRQVEWNSATGPRRRKLLKDAQKDAAN